MATATKKKGSKAAKVKWAIGGVEPEDLPDFKSNDEIGLPPKGVYNFSVKKVTRKENKNGDMMLTVTCEISEKSKDKKKYNGYTCWERLNVTEQGAPYLKRWLTALGVKWSDFIKNTVVDETTDPETIVSIGSVKFGTKKEVIVRASTRYREYEGEDQLDIARFLPPAEEVEDEPDEDEDEEGEDIELEDDDEADEDSEDDEDDEDEDSDEEDEEDDDDGAEDELREELSGLTLAKLKKRAIAAGLDADDMPTKKADIIDSIVELELGDEEDEDEDEDEEEVDEDELREELEELGLPDLRSRAKSNGAKVADVKGKKKPELIDLIVEQEASPF